MTEEDPSEQPGSSATAVLAVTGPQAVQAVHLRDWGGVLRCLGAAACGRTTAQRAGLRGCGLWAVDPRVAGSGSDACPAHNRGNNRNSNSHSAEQGRDTIEALHAQTWCGRSGSCCASSVPATVVSSNDIATQPTIRPGRSRRAAVAAAVRAARLVRPVASQQGLAHAQTSQAPFVIESTPVLGASAARNAGRDEVGPG